MVKEIKFLVTGEVRRPKMGDWFLSAKGVPICAAQDFNTSQYPILTACCPMQFLCNLYITSTC